MQLHSTLKAAVYLLLESFIYLILWIYSRFNQGIASWYPVVITLRD